MTTLSTASMLRSEAIDCLFSCWQGGRVLARPLPPPGWAATDATAEARGSTAPEESEPPPAIQSAADLRAANDWLQRERQRLQEYTAMQLARIQREHQAFVQQIYASEKSTIVRCQELSRKEEMLAQQSQALREQTATLSVRERAVAARLEQWSRIQGELASLSQARAHVEQDTQEQRALLEALRLESAALRKARESAQAELEALGQALNEQRESRAREQALARAQQEQMERRLREVDQAERAAQRRVAELDELESRLREEFEEQERQLVEQRREIAALRARLRQQAEGVANAFPDDRQVG